MPETALPDPLETMILPRYGEASLSELLPSAAAVLGVPGFENVLGLPDAATVCVLLVDGFGWNLLRRSAGVAPYLATLMPAARPLTAGFPSTTATSVTSIGTGLPPGEHGVLGYQFRIPHTDRLMHALNWDPQIDPLRWQSRPTVFERLAVHGTAGYQVAPGSFQESGLTRAGLRGARYVAAETPGDLVAGVAKAARHTGGSLIYTYYADLDKTGHLRGCESPAWEHQLAMTDRFVEQLIGVLPDESILVITGDHGMVDVTPDAQVDIDVIPPLTDGVTLIGGEPRMRYVYAKPGAEAEVLDAWRGVLGERAWVASREQAADEGWFGPHVPAAMLPRIGDVVA
ncbi:MAG: hypothetical protein QOD41_4605, partial [Cryptosporangiaceae bacterium]|nr:hypothetical protein [Cryptosporangiaceae bacterium]